MNKHDRDFRAEELYYYERVDRIVFWDPSIKRFIRRFNGSLDESIGMHR